MSIQIFNITWLNVSDNLLPWYWRNIDFYDQGNENPFWLRDWCRSTLIPIENLTNRLFELAFNIQHKTNRTGQHGVLEIVLNDDFDAAVRRIFLSDAAGPGNYNYDFYKQGETDPTPQSFYKQGEVDPTPKTFFTGIESAGEFDFFVNFPVAVSVDEPRLRGVVDTYRPSGKRYDVLYF